MTYISVYPDELTIVTDAIIDMNNQVRTVSVTHHNYKMQRYT